MSDHPSLRACVFVAVAIEVSASAWCAPADDYTKAMARGHQLEKKGDHAGALKAFDEALLVRKDDPEALLEAGWSAYKTGDLVRAQQSTGAVLARLVEPQKKAAALYNLGRIQEDQGRKTEAAASYTESLKLRPNATVEARLRSLNGGAAGAASADSLKLVHGPFPSIDAFCKTLPVGDRCFRNTADDDNAPLAAKSVSAPYRAVEAFAVGRADTKKLAIAFQTAPGWFVYGAKEDSLGAIAQLELVVRDVGASGGPVVVSRTIQSWASADEAHPNGRWTEHCTQVLTVCGVGESGAPSCLAPLAVAGGACNADDRAATKWDWKLDEKLAGGQLALKAGAGRSGPEAKVAIGSHPLSFP